jgi:site-specific DNA-methyltransferase (adenine-specific)
MGNPFRKQHELLFYVNRETYQYRKSEGITYYPTVLKYKPVKDKLHGAQKPLQFIRDLILGFSDEGETIFDPFIGSDTTGVACVETGRNFIGIELNPEYCEIARKRIAEHEPLLQAVG